MFDGIMPRAEFDHAVLRNETRPSNDALFASQVRASSGCTFAPGGVIRALRPRPMARTQGASAARLPMPMDYAVPDSIANTAEASLYRHLLCAADRGEPVTSLTNVAFWIGSDAPRTRAKLMRLQRLQLVEIEERPYGAGMKVVAVRLPATGQRLVLNSVLAEA